MSRLTDVETLIGVTSGEWVNIPLSTAKMLVTLVGKASYAIHNGDEDAAEDAKALIKALVKP